jgi:hypothetical protein
MLAGTLFICLSVLDWSCSAIFREQLSCLLVVKNPREHEALNFYITIIETVFRGEKTEKFKPICDEGAEDFFNGKPLVCSVVYSQLIA